MNPFMLIPLEMQTKLATAEIVKCNVDTSRFGLALTQEEAKALIETRAVELEKNGRIEFGAGIIDKLIREFCDSPFISQYNYTEILHELIEIFYYFKNETLDMVSDDELISAMKKYFDDGCRGSVEFMQSHNMEWLAHCIRSGIREEETKHEECTLDEEDACE